MGYITHNYSNSKLGKGRDEYAFDWWDSLYTQTATKQETVIQLPQTTEQKSLYSNFVIGEKLEKKDFSNRVSDKELFALCGNRSGNQRARLNAALDSDNDDDAVIQKVKVVKVKESKEEKTERRRLRQLRKEARVIKKIEKQKKRELKLIKKEEKNNHKRTKIMT